MRLLRLADRVDLMKRDFDLCLDLGAHDGRLSQHLAPLGKIRTIVHTDPANRFSNIFFQRIKIHMAAPFVVHDFTNFTILDNSFDAVFSCLNFHWVDDLPGLLLQIRHLLRPDGLCLVNLLGGDSLHELRASLIAAEQDITVGPRAVRLWWTYAMLVDCLDVPVLLCQLR